VAQLCSESLMKVDSDLLKQALDLYDLLLRKKHFSLEYLSVDHFIEPTQKIFKNIDKNWVAQLETWTEILHQEHIAQELFPLDFSGQTYKLSECQDLFKNRIPQETFKLYFAVQKLNSVNHLLK